MTLRIIHDQTKTESRNMGLSLCGGKSSRPTPARGQDGAHLCVVGSSNSSGTAKCSTVSPVTRLRGIAISRSYGIQFARQRSLPNGSSVRRVVCSPDGQPATFHVVHDGRIGELCYAARLPDQFARAVMAARRQFSLLEHCSCQGAVQ
jgi:hypothetical protein